MLDRDATTTRVTILDRDAIATPVTMLDRAEIAARIPHGDSMCLLDRVVSWDVHGVRCTASSHRSPDNPLLENANPDAVPNRLDMRLPVWAGVEYAAQAVAVHGSLVHARTAPRQGVLAAARNVVAACDRLDEFDGDLAIGAIVKHSDPAGAIYAFEVHAGERLLLSGKFTLMFIAERDGADT